MTARAAYARSALVLAVIAMSAAGTAALVPLGAQWWHAPLVPAVAVLGAVWAVGVAAVFMGWRAAATWIAGRLTTLALLGTVAGLVQGLLGADLDHDDPAALDHLVHALGLAFCSTLAGLGGFILLDWLLFLTRPPENPES